MELSEDASVSFFAGGRNALIVTFMKAGLCAN
jgi:hypothetical protein